MYQWLEVLNVVFYRTWNFRNYKVAKPEWITESVKANRLLSWHRFSTLRVPNSLSRFESGSFAPTPSNPPELLDLNNHLDNVKEEDISDQGRLDAVKSEMATEDFTSTAYKQRLDLDPIIHADGDQHMLENIYDSDPQLYAINVTDSRIGDTTSPPEDESFLFEDLDLDQLELQLTPPSPEPASTALVTNRRQNDNAKYGEFSQIGLSTVGSNTGMPVGPRSNIQTTATMSAMVTKGEDEDPTRSENNHSSDNRHPTLIELSVPWNRLNSSVQPGFVEKFYQSSRLHYLSTWKAKLREVTAEIQKTHPHAPSNGKRRVIM
jgi:hypothetical protein